MTDKMRLWEAAAGQPLINQICAEDLNIVSWCCYWPTLPSVLQSVSRSGQLCGAWWR